MKILALMLIPIMWTSPVLAQSVGLFADSLGTNCNIEIPFTGGTVKAYAIGTLEGAAASGVIAAAFKVDGLPAGWSTVVTPGPQIEVMIGNPFVEGTVLAYSACTSESRLLLCSALITPTSLVHDIQLQVAPHSQYGDTCYFTHDCGRPCMHFCDCTGIPQCICAEGLLSHINGAPCIVSVQQSAWGQLKVMYR